LTVLPILPDNQLSSFRDTPYIVCLVKRQVVGFARGFSEIAQKEYLEVYKPAETVDRTQEIRMLNYAGEILLALGLLLSSLLSYWLVWKLNGLGKFPEPQRNLKQEKSV
jgi:hypothetical protein